MSELALQRIRENIQKHRRGEDARLLDLGNCGMTEVPEEIGECVWLEELVLSGEWLDYDLENGSLGIQTSTNEGTANKIECFPAALSRLINLKKVKT
ncbi:MAG: hypothetical protein JNJ90_04060 [Saprospiraceae bacterium]|jgi:internalin A|nr:hypothetical protein [Saprospiraceae bacterium]